MKYDVFISYRRSSYDTANLIATRLRAAGYSVFFDMETLRSGKFNEQLYDVIDNCTDFILVLPPNALDRCVNEDDWVRLEILRAMNADKNIVPVMLNGFTWPNPMPDELVELPNYQALTASSIEYFDLALERLQNKYLLSKRRLPIDRILKYAGIFIFTLLVAVSILWGCFIVLSKDVCQKYATKIAMEASAVHMIAEQNADLAEDWRNFDNALNYNSEPNEVLQTKMLAEIELVEYNLKRMWNVDSSAVEITSYYSFLLSINGINTEEMVISPEFATLYYVDYMDLLRKMRNAVEVPNTLNRRFVTALLEVQEHSFNAYYASILSLLSDFPKKTITTYYELSKEWIYFPNNYEIGRSAAYYEDIVSKENSLAEERLARFESVLEKEDATLVDLEIQNQQLEQQMGESFSEMQSKIDSVNAIIQAAVEIDNLKKENEQELALQREKVEAKKVLFEANKAELEELNKQYVQTYENLKSKCTLDENDDQWYKWGKIRRWGTFLAMLVESREDLKSQGIYSTSPITPEVAYADMNGLLSAFQTYHPESKEYVAATKKFFKEVSKSERQYAGVIVFAFQNNMQHPFLKHGDIIVGYNGKLIKNYEELKNVYRIYDQGDIEFLRLVDDEFEVLKNKIEKIDIVGFLDLTE